MVNSRNGAKSSAASLHKALLDGSGFDISYSHCLEAVACAAGYGSWHEFNQVAAPGPVDASLWRRRLVAALPRPCHGAALAWLNRQAWPEESSAPDLPPRWYMDVAPYWMASMGLHRRHTALLRRGSGPGQVLRHDLVLGLLMNIHGGPSPTPRLEPRALALVYRGDLKTLYSATHDHPDFDAAFAALIDAGVLEWSPDDRKGPTLRITAPPGLQEAVEDGAVRMALHWLEDAPQSDEGEIRLTQMLRVMAIDRPEQVASGLLLRDAGAHFTTSGPMSSVLSDLAQAGSLRSFALVYDLFVRIRPEVQRSLLDLLPAKVISRYLPQRGHSASALQHWTTAHPEWADDLRASASSPDDLIRRIQAMDAGLQDENRHIAA